VKIFHPQARDSMSATHFAQRLSETLHMVVAMNIAPFNSPYQAMAHAECENSFEIGILSDEASERLWE
jgi:hypothetical protein